jgi:8-oxo-dGTP pyrophosphatase MutT (NUDIX family)
VERLHEALAAGLPGLDAQRRMSPRPRQGWRPGNIPADVRNAAALLLVYRRESVVHLLLTLRHRDLKAHGGQISLPGGAIDEGESVEEAARREAWEEVGLAPESVNLIGRLTPLHIPASGFLMHPVLAWARPNPELSPADAEVERLLETPFEELAASRNLALETWTLRGHDVDVPFFDLDGHKVWGATAMVLAEFLTLLDAAPDPWSLHASTDTLSHSADRPDDNRTEP